MTTRPGVAARQRQEWQATDPEERAMTDAELVERFATERDEAAAAAFETLVARHGPMVLSVCRQMLGNAHDADDAFQATFLVLVRKAGTVRVEESLGNWLYGVAYKVAARARAGLAQRQWHESRSAAMTAPRSEGEPTLRDLEPILHEELSRLPSKYRAPVVLCYLEGLTHDEAAERLGWPLGTVKGRLARARDLLRGRLSRRGVTRSAGLVLALFTSHAADAKLPEGLAADTARAALQTAAAEASAAASAGAASASAAALADAVVHAMVAAKVKLAVAVVMAAGAVTLGADWPPILPPRAQAQEALAADLPAASVTKVAAADPQGERTGEAPRAAVAGRESGFVAAERLEAAVVVAKEPSSSALAQYREARTQVGRDPQAHVRLALWCESHGLKAERLKHLAIALLHDPSCASARGLLGLVAYQGRWERPEAITERIAADADHAAKVAEYNARRNRTPNTAAGHWRLALWCEQQGLSAEARAHCAAVTRLDPTHEAAWKRLDCRRWNGRWMTEAQAAAERARAEAQRLANHHWRPLLLTWRGWLADREKRPRAEALVAGVTDPLAVPSIWVVFGVGNAAQQTLAVQLLGQIDAPDASRALAALAVFGRTAEVRRIATETLLHRDPRDFVPALIALMLDRVKYEVRPVRGPGSPGVLFVEGERFNVQRLYTPPPLPALPPADVSSFELDADGMPVLWVNTGGLFALPLANLLLASVASPRDLARVATEAMGPNSALQTLIGVAPSMARFRLDSRLMLDGTQEVRVPIGAMVKEIHKSTQSSRQQLARDIKAVEEHNLLIEKRNGPIIEVLTHFTNQKLNGFREEWLKWWTDERGYATDPPAPRPKPTMTETIAPSYMPQPVEGFFYDPVAGYTPRPRTSCFSAGTLVRTQAGLEPIETLRIGDQVLTQDPETGALSYEPIVNVFHNRPKPLLKIDLGSESILATGIHRFWRAGKGWTMARELQPGDTLRTLDGVARVESVEPAPVQPVFNLEVARNASFFVSRHDALVHDNTLVEPTLQAFDAPMHNDTTSNPAALAPE